MTDVPPGVDPEMGERLIAAVDLIRRTGASECQMRYSDDEEPTVWFVVAKFDRYDGFTETAASINPLLAALRLLELLVDGGKCMHCERPTGFEATSIDTMPADKLICWYQYDPELKKFRRGCEGDQ